MLALALGAVLAPPSAPGSTPVPLDAEPWAIVVDPAGAAFPVALWSGDLVVVDPTTGMELRRQTLPDPPGTGLLACFQVRARGADGLLGP